MLGDLLYCVPRSNTFSLKYVATSNGVTSMRLVFTDCRQTVPNSRYITLNGVYFLFLIFGDVEDEHGINSTTTIYKQSFE